MMAKILVIDDDSAVAEAILNVVRSAGHEGAGESTLQRGLNRLQEDPFDLVFLDVNLPDGSGLDTLPQIQSAASSPEVIIVTGFGDPDGAELAIKNGAWDYLSKPLSVLSIRLPLERALLYREKKMGARPLMAVSREGIIGESPRLKPCFDSLAQAAASEANVLITGETGTGKELFAWAIHRNGARRDRNFVVVDCAALPETLVESTLFGQLKGAFTGEDKPRDGLIKQANGGTLFLDEVGELPISLQKVFLRVLQEKRFRPVGGGPEVASDFRLVAATNRDLARLVEEGRFREDLLHRLRTLVLEIPPLRERPEDIKELAIAYAARLCDQYKIDMKGFSPGFWEVLLQYAWPGNVRELIQALEKSILAAQDEPILFSKHLPVHIRARVIRSQVEETAPAPCPGSSSSNLTGPLPTLSTARDTAVRKIEEEYLRRLVQTAQGDMADAARISGLSISRLYALLKKYRIPAPGR
jgi:two-component system NtrC family response regulator